MPENSWELEKAKQKGAHEVGRRIASRYRTDDERREALVLTANAELGFIARYEPKLDETGETPVIRIVAEDVGDMEELRKSLGRIGYNFRRSNENPIRKNGDEVLIDAARLVKKCDAKGWDCSLLNEEEQARMRALNTISKTRLGPSSDETGRGA